MDLQKYNPEDTLRHYLNLPQESYAVKYNKTLQEKSLNRRRSETKSKLFSLNFDHSLSHDFTYDPFYDLQKTFKNLKYDLDAINKWSENLQIIDSAQLRNLSQVSHEDHSSMIQSNSEKIQDILYANKILSELISLLVVLIENKGTCNESTPLRKSHDITSSFELLEENAKIVKENCAKLLLRAYETDIILSENRQSEFMNKEQEMTKYHSIALSEDCLDSNNYYNQNKNPSSMGSSILTLRNNARSSTARSSMSPFHEETNSGCYMQESGSFQNLSTKHKHDRIYRSASLNFNTSNHFTVNDLNYSRFSDGTFSNFHLYNNTRHLDDNQNENENENFSTQPKDSMRHSTPYQLSRNNPLYDNQLSMHSDVSDLSVDADRSDCSSFRGRRFKKKFYHGEKVCTPRSSHRNSDLLSKAKSHSMRNLNTDSFNPDSSDLSYSSYDGKYCSRNFRDLAEKMDRQMQMKQKCNKICSHHKRSQKRFNRVLSNDNLDSLNISEQDSYLSNDENSMNIDDFIGMATDGQMKGTRRLKGIGKASTDSSAPCMAWDNDQYQIYTNSTEQDLSGSCVKLLSQFEDYSWDDRLSDLSLRESLIDNNTPSKSRKQTLDSFNYANRDNNEFYNQMKNAINFNDPDRTMTQVTRQHHQESPRQGDVSKNDISTMTEMADEEPFIDLFSCKDVRPKSTGNLVIVKSHTQTTSGYNSDLDSLSRSISHSPVVLRDKQRSSMYNTFRQMKESPETNVPCDKSIQTVENDAGYLQSTHIYNQIELHEEMTDPDSNGLLNESEAIKDIEMLFKTWTEINTLLNSDFEEPRSLHHISGVVANSAFVLKCKHLLEKCEVSKRRVNQIFSQTISRLGTKDNLSRKRFIYQHLKDITVLIDNFDLAHRRIYNVMVPLIDEHISIKRNTPGLYGRQAESQRFSGKNSLLKNITGVVILFLFLSLNSFLLADLLPPIVYYKPGRYPLI